MEDIQPLLELIARQNDQIIELSRVIAELKAKEPEPVFVETPVRTYPMHVPEAEEDARAAYEAGDISKEDLEEVLREVQFFTHEITVPTPGI